ncbi:MAG: hypothetical protein R2703_11120 [Micropruina glycogenica]
MDWLEHLPAASRGCWRHLSSWVAVAGAKTSKVVPGFKQWCGEQLYNMVRNGIARDILGYEYQRFTSAVCSSLFSLHPGQQPVRPDLPFMLTMFQRPFRGSATPTVWHADVWIMLYNGGGHRQARPGGYLKLGA